MPINKSIKIWWRASRACLEMNGLSEKVTFQKGLDGETHWRCGSRGEGLSCGQRALGNFPTALSLSFL